MKSEINSSVDGYHTKCGKWHNVGDCPLDKSDKGESVLKRRADWNPKPSPTQSASTAPQNNPLTPRERQLRISEKQKSITVKIKSLEDERSELESALEATRKDPTTASAILGIVITVIVSIALGEPGALLLAFILVPATNYVVFSIVGDFEDRRIYSSEGHKRISVIRDEIRILEQKRIPLYAEFDRAQAEIERAYRLEWDWWAKLDGWSFEKEVAELFRANGYKAEVTKGSSDGGIDINLHKRGKYTIVQCKNHRSAIGPAPIRDLFGVFTSVGATGAIMVSQTSYTTGARDFANRHSITLMTIDDMIRMQKL